MTVERTKNEVIFKVKSKITDKNLQRISNYLAYLESTSEMKVSDKTINELSQLTKADRWNIIEKKHFLDEKNSN